MKIFSVLLSLTCAMCFHVQAQTANHDALLARLKKMPDLGVRGIAWTSPSILQIDTTNGGNTRAAILAYVCDEAVSTGLKGLTVQVVDTSQQQSAGKPNVLGDSRCI